MDLNAAQQHVLDARTAGNVKLRELVETFMPGVSEIEMKPFRFSVRTSRDVSVGTWCDQTFEFEQWSDGTVRGYAVALCSSCDHYVHSPKARSLRTPNEIAAAVEDGTAAKWVNRIDQCSPCQQVVAAKDEAHEVTGRYSAWRFKNRWGMTHVDVLALPH